MAKTSKPISHLKKDKLFKKVIEKVGSIESSSDHDLYLSLMRAIVSQQLSVKAAATIWKRFLVLFKDGYPDAKKLLRMTDDKLRSVGLSYQKANYLKNIAEFSIKKTLDYKLLISKTDEELIEYLVEIKGVGRWTVEMLLMFSLNREDILPLDDLGVQNGIRNIYQLTFESKKDMYRQMIDIAESWRPHRTLACRYMWRYNDLKVK